MTAEMWRAARVALDCGENPDHTFTAYVREGQHWNGWLVPYFTHREAEKVMVAINRVAALDREGPVIERQHFAEGRIVFVVYDGDNKPECFYSQEIDKPDGGRVLAWPIGGNAWCWAEVFDPPTRIEGTIADIHSDAVEPFTIEDPEADQSSGVTTSGALPDGAGGSDAEIGSGSPEGQADAETSPPGDPEEDDPDEDETDGEIAIADEDATVCPSCGGEIQATLSLDMTRAGDGSWHVATTIGDVRIYCAEDCAEGEEVDWSAINDADIYAAVGLADEDGDCRTRR